MALFLSRFVNKVDKKGRISVPASFRLTLESGQGPVLYLKPNASLPCLDGYGEDWVAEIQKRLDVYDIFAPERHELETLYFAEMRSCPFDGEGRINLSVELMQGIGVENQAVFVGLGRYFQIWEPGRFDAYREELRKKSAKSHTGAAQKAAQKQGK